MKCIICSKRFIAKASTHKCCSRKCSLIHYKSLKRKYIRSEKGKLTRKRYQQSEAFKTYQKKYRKSDKYRQTQKRYRASEKYQLYKQSDKYKTYRKNLLEKIRQYRKSELIRLTQKNINELDSNIRKIIRKPKITITLKRKPMTLVVG